MKKRRKKTKATEVYTWHDKLNDLWVWAKDKAEWAWNKFLGTAFDEELPLALGLILTGGAILAGCLDPWKLIGLLGVVLGGVKLYRLFKWH